MDQGWKEEQISFYIKVAKPVSGKVACSNCRRGRATWLLEKSVLQTERTAVHRFSGPQSKGQVVQGLLGTSGQGSQEEPVGCVRWSHPRGVR